MGTGLAEALKELQAVLVEEYSAAPSEALTARKEAAVSRLQALLSAGESPDANDEAVMQQLRGLLASNRFSLKWNGLRAQLGQLSRPKAAVDAPRPRLDLVH